MRIANMFVFGLLILLATVQIASAQSMPVTISKLEANDVKINVNDNIRLDLERSNELELRVDLFASEAVDNVNIRAEIDGYEFSNVEPISALEGPFDLSANITYQKKLTLQLPEDMEVGSYKLRVFLVNKNDYAQIAEYNLEISTTRHSLRVDDITFNPGRTVTAGQALIGSVRVENKGQKVEKDVRVAVSIPALGLESIDYIERINDGDSEEETEEFFLRLPQCAEPGVYDVNVDVFFNKGHDKVSETTTVNVLENEACKKQAEQTVVVVQQAEQPVQPTAVAEPVQEKSTLRSVLEVILIVLVALLVIVGLVIVLTRLREE